ncbi:FAD-dependent monooxygenase [Paeniglutamicibacter gangotriensis]|uniref:FAD-dependent monooxygenase n=1 Tax=Paeniglutamicibacter gangotriensis TaxID=254787 RepID=UPI0037C5A8BF
MRALIIGAGIAGLAAAGALARDGWETTVLEQASGPRTAGYMIDFFEPGFTAAQSLGALSNLREYGQFYTRARYVDATGRTRAQLSMDSFLNAAGGKFFSILRPDIERGLREWVGHSTDIVQGAKVVSLDPGRYPDSGAPARVTLQDGREFGAELLIGADGIHSTVRSCLPVSAGGRQGTGPDRFLRHLGFHVFGYVFSDAALAARLGAEVLLTDSLTRQAGLYALPDGRVTFFGIVACNDPAPDTAMREDLFTRFRGLGPLVDQALERRPADMYEDFVAQSVVGLWHHGRSILLGDAAYAVSPLAGQGASLAVAGAELLTRTLRERDNDLSTAFADYEAAWRPVVEEQQAAGRRNTRFFVPPNRTSLLLRRGALHLMNLRGLNAFMARRAFGSVLPTQGPWAP